MGFDTSDDALVYKVRDDLAVVQTVDAAARQLGIPAARVVAGGFSQGSVFLADLARQAQSLKNLMETMRQAA